MSAMQRPGNPMQKQGGSMSPSMLSQLPPGIQQAIAARQMGKQGGPMQQNPMQQMQQNPMQQMGKQGDPMQQGGFPPYLGPMMGQQGGPMQQNPMQQGAAGGKGGMPGAQGNPMMGPQGGGMPPWAQNFAQQQQAPMGQQGGMLGPAPNAMQQFSQQQGLAGLMQPQQSSTNSLQ